MKYSYECRKSLSAKDMELVNSKAHMGWQLAAINVKMNERLGSSEYIYWFKVPEEFSQNKYQYTFSINYAADSVAAVNRKLEDGWELITTQITMPEQGGLPNYILWFGKKDE